MSELVSEGNIGLMTAVKKFDPEKGFRLATYAMWWIKASIQEYILRSWSLVKIGTTAAQKKLFFNLRKMKNQIMKSDQSDLLPEQVTEIANRLDVSEDEVNSMDQRMKGPEASLNASITGDDGESEWQDWVVDENADQELQIAHRQESNKRKALLDKAMVLLNDREKAILFDRRLNEEPKTLEELSKKHKVSRERIRQIENRAFEKIQKKMIELAREQKLISV